MAKTAPPLDLIAVGESLRDVFYMIHEATVQCRLHEEDCLLCLHYADKIPVDHIVKIPAAGNSANAAVCASRLGLRTGLVTWIGDDYAGQHIFSHLAQEKVNTTLIERDHTHPTSESTIIDFKGEKTQLVYFQPRKYILPKLPKTRGIYYSAMGNTHGAFDQKLLKHLSAHPEIFFTFQPGTTHVKEGMIPSFKRLLARSDLFILNREEAASLLQDGDEVQPRLAAFHKLGAKRVVITDGKKGAYGSNGSSAVWFMPSFPGKPKETTGAGDSFAATMTSMLLLKKPFEEAMQAAAAMASSVIEHVGPQRGLLKTKDLQARLKKSPKIKAKLVN